MNIIIMNQDVHTPAFIKADASNKTDKIKQQPTSPKQVHRFWKSHTNLTHPGKYFRPSKVKIMRPTSPK